MPPRWVIAIWLVVLVSEGRGRKVTVPEDHHIKQGGKKMDHEKDGVSQEETPKKPWEEPKLGFVEPKLTKHGDLKNITGFFGPFSPG